MADKKTFLLFVDKNKLWLFSALSGETFNLDIPTTVMKDMEVLNHELFIKQYESFIAVHSVNESRIYIVIATPLLFVKDFSGIEDIKREEAITSFIENVPFDSISKTTMHFDKTMRVIVANKGLITLIKNSLDKHKCEVIQTLPANVFTSLNVINGLDLQTARTILAQADSLRAYNLLDPQPVPNTTHNITVSATDKEHPKRLPLLLGTFGGLLSLLVGVSIVSNSQPTLPPSRATGIAKAPKAIVTVVPNIQSLRIDVIRNDQKATVSSQLKTVLQSSGVSDVREFIDNSASLSASQIIFSNTVSISNQGQIMNIVKTIDPVFSTQVVAGLARDVEIRLK